MLRRLSPRRGERSRIAEALSVSPRTLWNWERRAGEREVTRPVGRPPQDAGLRWRCLYVVARELSRSRGRLGECELAERLRGRYPRRLIREVLVLVKARWRAREAALRSKLRLVIEPAKVDTLWSLDATWIGREGDQKGGKALWSQVLVDAKSRRVLAVSLGDAPTGEDAVRLLEETVRERGRAPLVLSLDNGAPYVSKPLRSWLEREGVTALRNQPATPQHNPWVERENRGLKREVGRQLGEQAVRGERPVNRDELLAALAAAMRERNDAPRWCRGRRSADECDGQSRRWYDAGLRSKLVEQVRQGMDEIEAETGSAWKRRGRERQCVLDALVDLGCATVRRGGRPKPWPISEKKT